MQYSISNERMIVTADTFGGELVSVLCDGKEKLWQGAKNKWERHAPPLFPVCGHCDMIVDGKEYPIPSHGFAINSEFSLKEQGKDYLTFTLSADEETKKIYPFDFMFDVTYSINGNVLTITQTVKNPAQTQLYFSLGGHESFMMEKPFAMHELLFEKEEEFVHFMHNPKGYLSEERKDFGRGKKVDTAYQFSYQW